MIFLEIHQWSYCPENKIYAYYNPSDQPSLVLHSSSSPALATLTWTQFLEHTSVSPASRLLQLRFLSLECFSFWLLHGWLNSDSSFLMISKCPAPDIHWCCPSHLSIITELLVSPDFCSSPAPCYPSRQLIKYLASALTFVLMCTSFWQNSPLSTLATSSCPHVDVQFGTTKFVVFL